MVEPIFPLRVPAIRVLQPLGEFFVAVLPADLLIRVAYSDPLEFHGIDSNGSYELKGNQRKLIQDRLKSIGRFVDTVEAAFPNSIILAANYHEDGSLEEDESRRWRIEMDSSDENIGTLVIPTPEKLASIVDGQHRLYGFGFSEKDDRRTMPLLCSVYLDLPQAFQAYLFATINYNQKPVDKSQSYELFAAFLEMDTPLSWSPDKVAVFLCRKLNTDPESPFRQRIAVAAQIDPAVSEFTQLPKGTRGVSTSAVVEGILRLFSTDPKRDRDELHKIRHAEGRSRSMLAGAHNRDKTPLRQLYIEANDLVIYTIILNFFKASKELLWSYDPKSYICKTVGIQAQFDLLKSICPKALEQRNISQNFFSSILMHCRDIDFSDDFFQASGVGRGRLRTSLELATGLRRTADCKIEDIATYRRLRAIK